tara:strand:- start:88 stop:987 length:900 start_codon:yes stop_codon:yes gene_type:complete
MHKARTTIVPALLLALTHTASALNLFTNPFAPPKQTPISPERRNFAVPTHPDLVALEAQLPVYEVPSFLSDEECAELVAAAEGGRFPPIPYGDKNRIFTGSKWAAAGTPEVAPFMERSRALFGGVSSSRFEPITVTRYCEGQYQAEHLDARLQHQVVRNAPYLKTGGQRIAQVIVYLQPPEDGGETKFFGPEFGGLAVRPELGKALVFPVASLDGEADERYLHSGEPVRAGTKWILGTWLMEVERTDADEMARAIDSLWELAGTKPPPSRAAASGMGAGAGAKAKPAAKAKNVKKKKKR